MGDFQNSIFKLKHMGAMVVMAGVLTACGGNEPPLPGERIAIRPAGVTAQANQVASISLPTAGAVEWSHQNGSPAHTNQHAAFSGAPSLRWSTNIGSGNGRDTRISSGPVAGGGLIYVMDGESHVSAVTSDGAVVWTLDTTPAGERGVDGAGGGVSFSGGVVYAGTGFGEVIAISAETGGILWRRSFDAPFHSAPTIVGGTVYAVTRGDTAYGISASDGALEWVQRGSSAPSGGFNGGASPAVANGQAILPFSSGDVLTVRANNGQPQWRESLDEAHLSTALARFGDISGDPVIVGNKVYLSNISGQTVQLNLSSGSQNWSLAAGAIDPVWPVGGSIFLVSGRAQLMRVNASNGQLIWAQQLPEYENPEKRKGAIRHYGPVLAGGLMWVASRDGALRGFSLESGEVVVNANVPNGAAAAPIIVGGIMYILSLNGDLHAFQ